MKPPAALVDVAGLRVAHHLDDDPVVYFLCLKGAVVYVGQTVDLRSRLMTHKLSKRFDAVFFVPCPRRHVHRIEAEYIRRLRPPLNQQGAARRRRRAVTPSRAGDPS